MDFEIRKDLRPQGPRRLDPEWEEYFRLVDLGIGNTEAWYRAAPPIVDTGPPWQAPEPPARPEEPIDPSRYLTEADRIHLADRLREKAFVRAIAAELPAVPPP